MRGRGAIFELRVDEVGGGSSRLRLDRGWASGWVGIRGGCCGARWSASEFEMVSSIITKSCLVLKLVMKPEVAPAFIFKGNRWSR